MKDLAAIILAAGKGTRMKSDLPKVAHEVAGRPMVWWVARACAQAGCSRIVLVVGHQREVVEGIFEGFDEPGVSVEFAVQEPQLGTGHAVQCAMGCVEDLIGLGGGADVFVLAGDGPLIRAETLLTLRSRHDAAGASASLATAVIDDPSGYGRIVRDGGGAFRGIVEHKNCTDEQLAIREVNPSYYCFDGAALARSLPRLARDEKSGEYFITDVPGLLLAGGERVEVVGAVPAEDVLSINTPEQLRAVDLILRGRAGEGGDGGGDGGGGVGEGGEG